MMTKFKIFEAADFLKIDSELIDKNLDDLLDSDTENSYAFMCENVNSELYIFSDSMHVEYFINNIVDIDNILEELKDLYPYNEDEWYDLEEYEDYIQEKVNDYVSEVELIDWIRGRLWVDQKVIGFWNEIENDDLKIIIDRLNNDLNIKIDGDWYIHIGIDNNYKDVFVKLKEYTNDLISVDMLKKEKEKEKIHLMKYKNKKKALKDYKFKKSKWNEWMKKGIYSKNESQNTENDDHIVNQNVNINNDKNFGVKKSIELPLDYFKYEDDGEINKDDDYYSTSAGRSGLYYGVEPGKNKGVNSKSSAVYKMSAESIISFNDFIFEKRIINYRGFEIIKNEDLSPGAVGYWYIPKLYYRNFANKIEQGYDTLSITQAKEAIDEWYNFNQKVKKYKE